MPWFDRALGAILVLGSMCGAGFQGVAPALTIRRSAVVSMSWAFKAANEGWEHGESREFLGCLLGWVGPDTIHVTGWVVATDIVAFRTNVGGACPFGRAAVIGTWHTHPWSPDSIGGAVKTRAPSLGDVAAFQGDTRLRVLLVVWGEDSLSALVKDGSGVVQVPRVVIVR